MVVFGLTDGVLGVAWPSMSQTFRVNISSLGVMTVAFTSTYTGAGFLSGWLSKRVALGLWLAMSGTIMAIGFLGYALAPSWWVLLVMTAIAGVGGGFLDSGLNLFVAIRLSPRLTNWVHSAFSLGGFGGAPIMTVLIVSGVAWDWGFVLIGGLFGLFVISVLVSLRRWNVPDNHVQESEDEQEPIGQTIRLTTAQLSMLSFFLYSGVEVVAAVWSFTLLTEQRGLSIGSAGTWVTAYFGGLVAGRALLGSAANRIESDRLLWVSAGVASIGALLFWLVTSGNVGFFALVLLGIGLGPVFPTLIAATKSKVGRNHVHNAIGFQIAAAALGGGLLPAGVGLLSAATNLEAVAIVIAVGCLLLLASLRVLARREILKA